MDIYTLKPAPFNTINLGMTQDQVIQLLGKPLQETDENGLHVLWYTSTAPTFGDYIYLKAGQVESISLQALDQKIVLHDVTVTYGQPEKSIRKYNQQESFLITEHLWPRAGFKVLTYGENELAQVRQITYFTKTDLKHYFSTAGKDLVGNQEVTTSAQLGTRVVPSGPNYTYALIGISITLILLISYILLRKFRRK